MPIYEFYCSDCHTIFNFFSRRVNTDKRPDCPKCGRQGLERRVSRFAFSSGTETEPADGLPEMDEARLEKAMEALAGEMEGVDESNPRQMARFMRKLSEATGMNLGSEMEEAMRRLEAGEDPEKIEEEMGDLFAAENPVAVEAVKGLKKKFTPPAHDDKLYTL